MAPYLYDNACRERFVWYACMTILDRKFSLDTGSCSAIPERMRQV